METITEKGNISPDLWLENIKKDNQKWWVALRSSYNSNLLDDFKIKFLVYTECEPDKRARYFRCKDDVEFKKEELFFIEFCQT